MSTSIRLGVFALLLAVVFAAGIGLGRTVGPVESDDPPAPAHDEHAP